MCGIAGLFHPHGALPFASGTVTAMCSMMRHRGPDDQGTYEAPFAQIGMRRLAIIDLDSGHQPISNEDGTVWVVFNGEIYNYRELRARLQRLGHTFATASDTECIVHAYEAYGERCVAELRGMFAIAILDLRQRRLVLARDRFGKKPLYTTTLGDGTVAFASELKCFFALPGFRHALSVEAVSDYFAVGYVPGPGSIYEGVSKLPAAHVASFGAGLPRVERYWTLSFAPKLADDAASLQARLRALLEDAVKARLVADVPFGAFLSGGLDSSIVAALMARNLGAPVKTFSIGFREARYSELEDARRVARHIGADHHELVATADAVALQPMLAWHFDEPFGDSSAIPTYLVAGLAAQHVKMVLSGDGGDELFGGYERYSRFLALNRLRRASGGLAGPVLRALSALMPASRAHRARRIAERLMLPFPERYLTGVALNRRADLERVLSGDCIRRDPYGSVASHYALAAHGAEMDAVFAGDVATYLADDILVKVDRMTMARSLEARAPLLDHHLAEFAAALPLDQKIRGGRGKALLRKVASELLPAEVLTKPKQGFAIPLAEWLRNELRAHLLDTVHARSFRERGVFDVEGVQRCSAEHLDGARDWSEMLWLVLCFERWARTFLDGPVRAPAAEGPRAAPRERAGAASW
jgi:asparagine synthase (glutamine-hydrolysing)